MNKYLMLILAFFPVFIASAQTNSDSLVVETTMEELFTICNSVVPEGEIPDEIIFERLAPYILYNGNDAKRKNKTACDYNKVEDRKLVDKIGLSLAKWLENISDFKVVKFEIEKKGNKTYFILTINHKPLNNDKDKLFYFVKIQDKFLLDKLE